MSDPAPSSPPFARGILLSLGIVGFGLLLLLGLFLSPRPQPPQLPTDATPLVPDRRLRFVCCAMDGPSLLTDPLLARIAALKPDFVMLDGISGGDIAPLAEALKLQKFVHPGLFVETAHQSGVALLSDQQAFAQHPINGPQSALGVSAVFIINGRKFCVAAVHIPDDRPADQQTRLLEDWKNGGACPIVVGGRFSAPMSDSNLVLANSGWFEGLMPFVHLDQQGAGATMSQPLRFYLSPGWSSVAGGVLREGKTTAVWMDATAAGNAGPATTRSSTEP